MASRDYFKGKRIAVIGLGPNAEMVTDIKYLIKSGAFVALYDLRSEARIKNHIIFLRSIGLANYICGSVPEEDLVDMDLIILSHEYPRESSFLNTAKKHKIPVEYPETLFFRISPPLILVGILGVYGKSTVLSMLKPMLEQACAEKGEQNVYVIDPESSIGIIAHLKTAKNGDIVIARITEEMTLEYLKIRISPHVAVFTSTLSKPYYSDNPFEILNYQTYNNYIVAPDNVVDTTYTYKFQAKAKMLRTKPTIVNPEIVTFIKNTHDIDNAALAIQTAKLFHVEYDVIIHTMQEWKSLKGRIEFVKKVKGIEFYNDSASISNYSTETALKTLSNNQNLILIFGGMDRGYDYRTLYSILPNYISHLILLPGSGTMKERKLLQEMTKISVLSAPSVEEAVRLAFENANKSTKVLFSPGFAAGGIDSCRKDRGERFMRAVRTL